MAIDSVRRMTNPAVPTPTPVSTPTLRLNSRGPAVADLQRLLNGKGFKLTPDGSFGNKTHAAVVAFQRANGLTPDGIVGPKTWNALRSGGSTTRPGDGFDTRPQTPTTQTPTTQPQQPRVEEPADSRAELARGLVKTGGHGTAEDAAVIARDLSALPADVLSAAQRAGVRVVACRETVTDYMTELKGVRPRGWPPGSTWDQVPGLYSPGKNEAVIATVEQNGKRVISPRHGSRNMTYHELGHALDARRALGSDHTSRAEDFRRAYEADVPRLREQGKTYLLQEGDAGPNEAFAETFARYFDGDRTLQRDLPGMYAYWKGVEAELASR